LPATIIEEAFSGEPGGYLWLVLVILGYAFALFVIFLAIWIIWYGATLLERRRFYTKQQELTNSPDLNDIDLCGDMSGYQRANFSLHRQHRHHHHHRATNPADMNATITTTVSRPMLLFNSHNSNNLMSASATSANSTLCRPLGHDSHNHRNNKRVITNCTYEQHLFNASSPQPPPLPPPHNNQHHHLLNPNHFSLDVTNSPYSSPRDMQVTGSASKAGRRSSCLEVDEEEDFASIYSNPKKVGVKSSTLREKSAALAAAQQAQRSSYCKYRL
jgi:hypothetical protein